MPYLKLIDFAGTVPRTGPTLLENNQAQYARNVKLQSKELRSWKKPVAVYTPKTVGTKSIYKLTSTAGNPIWLEWGTDVDVVAGPIPDFAESRIYYTGAGTPKKTNFTLAKNFNNPPYPNSYYELGVPSPTQKLTVASGAQPLGFVTVTNGGSGYTSAPVVSISGGGGSGATATAKVTNGAVTEVVITNRGSGYTSAPTISFSGSGGAGAAATAVIGELSTVTVTDGGAGGQIASVTVNASGLNFKTVARIRVINGGTGFASPPTVTISGGGGSGATATAVLTAGVVTAINITANGSNYTSDPTVTISGGGGGGATAVAYRANVSFSGGGGTGADAIAAVSSEGVITSISVIAAGKNYIETPTITITGGLDAAATAVRGVGYSSPPSIGFTGGGAGATGALAEATITNGVLTSIRITNRGQGFTSVPAVGISGGGGSGAQATVTINAGVVVAATITAGGSGYGPSVSFSGGGGSNAVGQATVVNGVITAITLTNSGTGYVSPPTVSISGGGGAGATATASFAAAETRNYVYTYLSTFGSVVEESGPSPASDNIAVGANQPIVLTQFLPPPGGAYNFTGIRLYRTVVGAGSVSYLQVAELPITTSSYTDTKLVAELGASLPSLYWNPPPSTLAGIVSLPNGILAGFTGNQVWFSEPYYPHAWPENYMLTVDHPIVGLGVFDTSLVVLTERNPYIISGAAPSSMTQQKLPLEQPCISKRSIQYDNFGVLYASPNGLVAIGPGIQNVITTPLYTRDEWQELMPETMLGMIYNNMYLGFYDVMGKIKAIVMSRGDIPPLVELNFDATAVFIDRSTADIYGVSKTNNLLYQLDADTINSTVYEWRSKKFVLPNPTNFAAMKVQGDFDFQQDIGAYNALVAQITAANQALFNSGLPLKSTINDSVGNSTLLNGSILTPIPPIGDTRSINVFVYGDEALLFESGITSQVPVRMASSKKATVYEVLITGNTPVRSLEMATSINELRQLPG